MKKKTTSPKSRLVSHNIFPIESALCETCVRGIKVMSMDGSYGLSVDFADGVIIGPKSRLVIEVTVREEPIPRRTR